MVSSSAACGLLSSLNAHSTRGAAAGSPASKHARAMDARAAVEPARTVTRSQRARSNDRCADSAVLSPPGRARRLAANLTRILTCSSLTGCGCTSTRSRSSSTIPSKEVWSSMSSMKGLSRRRNVDRSCLAPSVSRALRPRARNSLPKAPAVASCKAVHWDFSKTPASASAIFSSCVSLSCITTSILATTSSTTELASLCSASCLSKSSSATSMHQVKW
mmetsp:Transcript_25509/g.73704  ORF Transcript_25509/g.73704 Transcript_25509/m.73704 type:complete len:219 (+) Transcript_25509:4984-5640(+)